MKLENEINYDDLHDWISENSSIAIKLAIEFCNYNNLSNL
jgi:hypothetical protein